MSAENKKDLQSPIEQAGICYMRRSSMGASIESTRGTATRDWPVYLRKYIKASGLNEFPTPMEALIRIVQADVLREQTPLVGHSAREAKNPPVKGKDNPLASGGKGAKG